MVSLNSYGYSPYPLSSYIGWVQSILTSSQTRERKPFIISITSSDPQELSEMVEQIQQLRSSLSDSSDSPDIDMEGNGTSNLIAIELNTSCPNIPSHPPPAYHVPTLRPLVESFAQAFRKDKTLTLGLKLAPFVYRKQQEDILDLISEFTDEEGRNPIAFLSCTNTLGSCTLFTDQTGKVNGAAHDSRRTGFKDGDVSVSTALPTKFGGLAGEPLHYLSLG
jgi:dihydroorotate dehydrogenase (fumarate)